VYQPLHLLAEFKPNFDKVPDDVAATYNVPYDYKSLMHYYSTAYSRNGKKTIVAKVPCSLLLYQNNMININIGNTPFI
jgi:hypothetical protein